MARSLKVTVWNAAQHVLKVGPQRLLLHPGQSLVIDRDGTMDAMIESGKLVILEQAQSEPVMQEPVAEETTKRKKKEVVDTPPAEESTDEVSIVEDAEDSILPKEVD